jgi:phosphate acetyltransferase
MSAPNFSQIETGYNFPPVIQSYVQSAIDHYALASLDMNPVHTNEEWAARAQVFGMPVTVGHGMMTMSTLASVVTRTWGVVGKNGGSIRFVDSKFTKPVKVGETVTATGKVKQKHFNGPGKNWVLVLVEGKDSTGDLIGFAEIGYNLPD